MPKRERRLYPTNYPTDLTDDQWTVIEPLVTPPPSPYGGRPAEIDLRAIVNALIYRGCINKIQRLLTFKPSFLSRSLTSCGGT
jgi:hypothetical protein